MANSNNFPKWKTRHFRYDKAAATRFFQWTCKTVYIGLSTMYYQRGGYVVQWIYKNELQLLKK